MVAGIKSLALNGSTPDQLLRDVRASLERMVRRQEALLLDELIPALTREGIELCDWEALGRRRPDLPPRGLRSAHPPGGHPADRRSEPSVPLHLQPLAQRRASRSATARTTPPASPGSRCRPTWPGCCRCPEGDRFIPLEQTLVAFIDELFPGMDVGAPCIFRVTRDADLALDDDAADDLLLALQEELRRRRFLPVVRLEIDSRTSEGPVDRLTEELGLDPDDVYRFAGPLGLECLWAIHALDRPELHDEPWTPLIPPAFAAVEREEDASIFSVLDRQDVLVHHPYDSFSASVEELMNEAADDPHVLAIKQCLYRTSGDSPVVAALVRAAEHGKQVAVLVEVTARFDEEANIGWARALEEAGAHVIYGLMGLKTHAKTTLVVRQEGDAVRLYCHVGTGNYNPKTARMYEDLGVLSSRPALGADVTRFFNYITGFSQPPHYQELVTSPGGIRDRVIECIDEEAKAGPDGRIVIKVNGLDDVAVIDALYRASQAGVPIDLIIRGICCLRPGVPGLSETIRVRSIVGRFLEHSRILRFGGAGGRPAQLLHRVGRPPPPEPRSAGRGHDPGGRSRRRGPARGDPRAQPGRRHPVVVARRGRGWHRIPTVVGVATQEALEAAALERSSLLDDTRRNRAVTRRLGSAEGRQWSDVTHRPSRTRRQCPAGESGAEARRATLAWLYTAAAVILLPWIVFLAVTLPRRQFDLHYRAAWVGFDLLLVVAITRTAYMAFRVDPRVQFPATATATLLVVDAWFDITTSGSRRPVPRGLRPGRLRRDPGRRVLDLPGPLGQPAGARTGRSPRRGSMVPTGIGRSPPPERGRRRAGLSRSGRAGVRLMIAVDAGHDLVGQLGQDVEGGQVLVDLLDPAGPGDHRRDVRVLGAPGDGQLGQRAVELLGDRLERSHLLVALGVGEHAPAATRSRAGWPAIPRGPRRGTCR